LRLDEVARYCGPENVVAAVDRDSATERTNRGRVGARIEDE